MVSSQLLSIIPSKQIMWYGLEEIFYIFLIIFVVAMVCKHSLIYIRKLLKITRSREEKALEEDNGLKLNETFREHNN